MKSGHIETHADGLPVTCRNVTYSTMQSFWNQGGHAQYMYLYHKIFLKYTYI